MHWLVTWRSMRGAAGVGLPTWRLGVSLWVDVVSLQMRGLNQRRQCRGLGWALVS
jgi:hypothetical protein